jgi:hypothetical protein
VAISYILWPFGVFYGYLVYSTRFGVLYQEKSGNPAARSNSFKTVERACQQKKVSRSGRNFVIPFNGDHSKHFSPG